MRIGLASSRGPLAAAIGASTTPFGIFALELGSLLAVLAIPAVWMIRRAQPRAATTA